MHPNETAINDYVDESLDLRGRAELERHLESCGDCRAFVEDLREIVRATRSLELREPPARAWSRIERAIRLEPVARAAGATDGTRPTQTAARLNAARYTWLIAVAAALVLATAIGLRFSPWRRPAQAPDAKAGAAAVVAGDAAQSIETELLQAENHYEKAIKGLEQIASAEQGTLDPRTAATLQKNLAVVDQAISESRAAVRSEPASDPAQQSLIENFKTKIGLLQDTVALINEMRKGNEAGAARIASGLKQKGD